MGQNTIMNLVGNRDAIRKIMAMDTNGSMDRMVENAKNSGKLVFDGEGGSYTGNKTQTQPAASRNVVVNEKVMSGHRNMPKAILESFRKNPGKEESMSVLEELDMSQFNHGAQKDAVQEQDTRQKQSPVQTGIVDYSLLKTIINEAVQENVKKYMSALSKKLISEGIGVNTNEIQAIKIGKKLSIITENGDIYTSQLQKSGNVKDKINR